ncbi:hypothetical protein GGI15_004291, partial [Coemansia interrupta]
GFKRLSVPSTATLAIALLYFTCVILVSQSALRSRLQRSIENIASHISATTDEHIEWFSWKTDSQYKQNQQANLVLADAYSYVETPVDDNSKEEEPKIPSMPLVRLPGWPSEFPESLDDYRRDVLSNTSWATDDLKHRAEIAPYVWHHRGLADKLSEQSQSTDAQTSHAALREMSRLGILPTPSARRANAYFVVLLRNRELNQFLSTLRQLEDRFNKRYHYPYLFLNDEPFSQRFMQFVAASTTSNVTFATIPTDHWSMPEFVDEAEAREARRRMKESNVIYGGSLSYRHMCRFNSGFFYKHPLLKNVDWYWRVEPGVDFYCDLDYDPFMYMQENGKLYSFVIALKELEATIPSLWQHTLEYMQKTNVTSDLMSFFVSKSGNYNLCHFWSNFEIASLNWLRSDAYESYFKYLDRAKGFFMERWGDAPVHSIAAGMLLNRDQVHFFDDIGYRHESFMHCPDTANSMSMKLRCQCPKRKNFDSTEGSCLPRWKEYVPNQWTQRDTNEALRMMREARIVNSVYDPKIVVERRRWYSFFSGF